MKSFGLTLAVFSVLGFGLSGCFAESPNHPSQMSTYRIIDLGSFSSPKSVLIINPDVGNIAEKSLGETLIITSNKIIEKQVRISEVFTRCVIDGFDANFYIKSGNLRLDRESVEGKFYKSTQPIRLTLQGTSYQAEGGIYISKNNEQFIYQTTASGVTRIFLLDPQIKVTYEDHTEITNESFKQEFVYLGVVKGVATFMYREFIDSVARPAFSQEVKYDLNVDKTIRFKSLELQILEATNSRIKYKVIHPF